MSNPVWEWTATDAALDAGLREGQTLTAAEYTRWGGTISMNYDRLLCLLGRPNLVILPLKNGPVVLPAAPQVLRYFSILPIFCRTILAAGGLMTGGV